MATIPSLPLFTSGIAKSGQFNRLRDAIAFWQNPPAAMVTATVNQSISNATWTLLTFGSTSYDTDGIVTSTSRFTVQTPGRYSVVGKVVYSSSATGRRWIGIRKNSTGTYVTGTLLYATNIAATSAADHVIIPPGPEFQLSAGDTLEAFTFQDSGGSLNTAASGSDIHMAIRLVQSTATTSGDEGTTLPGALVQTLLGTADLNSVTTPGNYLQDVSANATAGRNYPIVRAGHLEVHGGASSSFVMQRYTEYDDSIARDVWVRTKYLTVWGAWQLMLNAAQTELGTEDLDTIKSPGFYIQSETAEATLARHYPVDSLNGHLVVESAGGASPSRVAQKYQSSASSTSTSRLFWRAFSGGTWSAWSEAARV